jgi:hypothetical protein
VVIAVTALTQDGSRVPTWRTKPAIVGVRVILIKGKPTTFHFGFTGATARTELFLRQGQIHVFGEIAV